MSVSAGEATVAYKWRTRLGDKLQARYGVRPVIESHGAGGTRLSSTRLLVGLPVNVTVSGGSIPASGAVTITPNDTELDIGEHPDGTFARTGFMLKGILGTIRRPGGRPVDPITFTRNVDGVAVPAAGSANVLTYQPGVTQHASSGLILIAGDNNIHPTLGAYRLGTPYVAALVAEVLTWWTGPNIWASLSSASKVAQNLGSDINGPGLPGGTRNPVWNDTYGTNDADPHGGFWGHFATAVGVASHVNIKDGMLNGAAFALSGISETAKDTAQMGPGKRYIPASLSNDNAHPSRYGEEYIAQTFFDWIVANWA